MSSQSGTFAGFLLCLFLIIGLCTAEIVIRDVHRQIDLSSQLPRHSIAISFLNRGSDPISEFTFSLPIEQFNSLSLIDSLDEAGKRLAISNVSTIKTVNDINYVDFEIQFPEAVGPQGRKTVQVYLIFMDLMKPLPKEITQQENQLVMYEDSHFLFSTYQVAFQESQFKLPPSSRVESFTQKAPQSVKGDVITFGPFDSVIPPLTRSPARVHFENNSPFVRFDKVVKEYEVSHWGNLAVEEHFDLRHTGARLKGQFSRFDFQRQGSPSAVHGLIQFLPRAAKDVYYRDDIGNISSSHVFPVGDEAVKFEILPRFVLFGGWKVSFYTGYNLPLVDFLSVDSSKGSFVLNVSFADTFANLPPAAEFVVRVILPEGAKHIKTNLPFVVDEQKEGKVFTYLDTVGRPVVEFKKYRVIAAHNLPFQVIYDFDETAMLHEPLLLVSAFFIFFLLFMICVRLDFQISEEKNQTQETIHNCLKKAKEIGEERSVLYQELETVLPKQLKSQNRIALNQQKSNAETKFKGLKQRSEKLAEELDVVDPGNAARIRELERKEQNRFELFKQLFFQSKRSEEQLKQYRLLEQEVFNIFSDIIEDL